jgi:hypothetical protein
MNSNVLNLPERHEGRSVLEYDGGQENIHEGMTLQLGVEEICEE